MSDHEQEPVRAHVEVWQQGDGSWRWRYVAGDGEERIELPSNEPDSSCDEAVQKASIAYPGVPVEVRDPPHGDSQEGHGGSGPLLREVDSRAGGRHRLRRVVVPALLAVGAVALAARRPRWWTAGPASVAVAVAVHRLRRR